MNKRINKRLAGVGTVVVCGVVGIYFMGQRLEHDVDGKPARHSKVEMKKEPASPSSGRPETPLPATEALPTTPTQEVAVNEEPIAEPSEKPNEEDENSAPFQGFLESMEQRLERARERDELLGRWTSEAVDPTWTSQESERITRHLLDADFSHDQLREVDCRETICRFSLSTSDNTQGEVRSLVQLSRGLQEETWLRAEPDDEQSQARVEVFMSRTGYRLSGGGGRIDETPVTLNDDGTPLEIVRPTSG